MPAWRTPLQGDSRLSIGVRETGYRSHRTLVHAELRSDLADETAQTPKEEAPPETGELGFADGFDRYHLTITVGFGASAYDKLGTAAEQRPQDLRPIPWDKLGDTPEVTENGDVVLQVCSDSVYVNEHVLRRIEHELSAQFQVVWCIAGHQRHTSRRGRVGRNEGRSLIGFLDGSSNLDPNNVDDASLIFVDPSKVSTYPPQQPTIDPGQPSPYGGPQPPSFPPDLQTPPTSEPAWTEYGSYLAVRASVIDYATWDQTALGDQEHAVGRWKFSGNALDQPDDVQVPIADPNFSADPSGGVTPLAAHIRKANPRTAEDDARKLFRRGYPIVDSTVSSLRRGLIFLGFGRTLTTQFEFITRAWLTNPDFPVPGAGVDALRKIDHVLAGGYFFLPPLAKARQPWSWVVPE